VRIGDGCATVTGYKLPLPLVPQSGTGKAGARFQARSQDTGLAVLVVVCNAVQPLMFSGGVVLRQLLRQREG